jgi:hypothetical protein
MSLSPHVTSTDLGTFDTAVVHLTKPWKFPPDAPSTAAENMASVGQAPHRLPCPESGSGWDRDGLVRTRASSGVESARLQPSHHRSLFPTLILLDKASMGSRNETIIEARWLWGAEKTLPTCLPLFSSSLALVSSQLAADCAPSSITVHVHHPDQTGKPPSSTSYLGRNFTYLAAARPHRHQAFTGHTTRRPICAIATQTLHRLCWVKHTNFHRVPYPTYQYLRQVIP